MAHGDSQVVELGALVPAECRRGGHLQDQCVLRAAPCRHRHAIVGRQVADRLDAGIDRVEVDWRIRNRHHTLDHVATVGLVPQIREHGATSRRHIDRARDQRVIGRRTAGDRRDLDFHACETEFRGLLLDKISVDRDQQRQV
jgi:hypothetical protein